MNADKTQHLLCTLSLVVKVTTPVSNSWGFNLTLNCWENHILSVTTKLARLLHLLRKHKHLITEPFFMSALFHSQGCSSVDTRLTLQ